MVMVIVMSMVIVMEMTMMVVMVMMMVTMVVMTNTYMELTGARPWSKPFAYINLFSSHNYPVNEEL